MDKIGKYEVIRKIGQGGFGVVYEGRDPFIKRKVAIKTCSAEDDEMRKRFFREGEIAGNLRHAHVVTVFDLGTQDGVPYLVQEYLPGEDLSAKIKSRDSLDDGRKLKYLVQVAEGLEYAHAQGVVHRDIKPANIRILEDDSVKIMDFGIAKLASAETQLTATGMAMGTAGYLPPEQIRGEKVDLRADIFSYGVLAYELLSGRRPFEANNMSAVLFQIIGQEPPALSSVWDRCTPEIERLVNRCLAKNPADRYESFTPLLEELRPIREATRGQTPQPSRGSMERTAVIPVGDTGVQLETLRGIEKRLRESVEQGDLTSVELELTLARKKHGDSKEFSQVFKPLLDRMAEIRKHWEAERQKSETLAGLVQRARSLREQGNVEETIVALQAALDIDSQNAEAAALLRSIEEEQARKKDAEEQARLAQEAAARIDGLVLQGELDAAEATLKEAQRRHGSTAVLEAAKARLAAARTKQRDAAVRERLTRAQAMEQAGQGENAQEVLREALQIHPENQEVKRALARITAAVQKQADEERKARNLEAAQQAVGELIRQGDLKAAGTQLSRHERELGTAPFRALRQQLKQAEQAAATRPTPVTRPGEEDGRTTVERVTKVGPQPVKSAAVPMALLGGGGLAALIVLGVVLYALLPKDDTTPTGEATPTAATPVTAATTGVLVLDAVPWAEVTKVVDGTGKAWDVPAARYTPLVMPLPPGQYTVTFSNPQAPQPVTKTVTVAAAATESVLAEFRPVATAEYFKKAGF